MRRSATSPRSRATSTAARRAARGEPRSFEEFLAAPDTEQIHFIGKDIIYFHTLFWPAMLRFAGAPYKVPDHVYVHGFITVSGEKMSKSRGTGISPLRYLEIGMNAEWLRYYIAAKLNANVEDLDFNPEDFIARVNSDLIGKYVNIASRAAELHQPPVRRRAALRWAIRARCRRCGAQAVRAAWRRATRRASSARRCAMSWRSPIASTRTSTRASPGYWRRIRRTAAQLQDVCSRALYGFKVLSVLLAPVLPAGGRARRARAFRPRDCLRLERRAGAARAHPPYKHLMTRVDPKQLDALFETETPAAAANAVAPCARGARAADAGTISIDDFKRLDLRVARIAAAESARPARTSS